MNMNNLGLGNERKVVHLHFGSFFYFECNTCGDRTIVYPRLVYETNKIYATNCVKCLTAKGSCHNNAGKFYSEEAIHEANSYIKK